MADTNIEQETLHPLLEDGCQGDERPEDHMKVAFVGISNWALDPAKMNRGILLQREVPDLEELENSARGICTTESNEDMLHRIEPLIKPMAKSYLDIFEKASRERREFYGLRDFYSLVKMVYAFMEKSRRDPTWYEIMHAVLRNFGGLEEVNPIKSFENNLPTFKFLENQKREGDPDCTPKGLIKACLFDTNNMKSESRYLLLLTENYGALNILQQEILVHKSDIRPITIFGSSFRSDQKYTQVCRNINKIKVCMETGNTVVLLNLENLYESLYDALNQYYVYFGGERYVDLGLGTHRVKCPVHKDFRLIVVAEKQTVYDKFPIPLINRLEKHFLTLANMLSRPQHDLVNRLDEWVANFVSQTNAVRHYARKEKSQSSKVEDVFMGYHDDTCSAIVIHVWPNNTCILDGIALDQILLAAQRLLMWCATPDAVVRLPKSALSNQDQDLMKGIYQEQQAHDSLAQYLHQALQQSGSGEAERQLYVQVTTHSKLLPSGHRDELSKATDIPTTEILLLDTLSSFDTEQQFSNKIQQFLCQRGGRPGMLVVQCDAGDRSGSLVACARYCVMDEIESARENLRAPVHVVFIIQLLRIADGCFAGFQCGLWHSVHIDDLRMSDNDLPTILDMEGKSVAALLETATGGQHHRGSMVTDGLTSDATSYRSPIYGAEAMYLEANERSPDQDTDYAMGDPVPSTSHADPYNPNNNTTQQVQQNPYSPGPTPLSGENVVVSLEMVGTYGNRDEPPRGGAAGPRKGLNVQSLILACVQEALSKVKDRQENIARTTDRVPLVLRLFHQNTGRLSFLHGVCNFIASLLKDKESSTYMANQWLTDEAANPDNIHRAGTFRRSCLQTLISKISPILAGVIAFLDTNQNLDTLDDASSPWKQTLWLDVLNTPKVIPLKYSDLQSPKRKELSEVIVMTTGCNVFRGQMPFSWLIYEQIEEVADKPTHMQEEDTEMVSAEESTGQKVALYAGVLRGSSIGALLDQIQDPDMLAEATEAYVSDFLHMVYKATTQVEHELVCQFIAYVANQRLEWLPQERAINSEQVSEGKLLQHLVSVHLAYRRLEPRLVYFQTMNQVWPECSQKIIELKENKPDSDLFQEDGFTFTALCLLIEDLNPDKIPGKATTTAGKSSLTAGKTATGKKATAGTTKADGKTATTGKTSGKDSALSDPKRRSQWLQKVYRYRQVIEKVIRNNIDDSKKNASHSHTAVIRASSLWSRVMVMKLFLEHVCASEDKQAINIKYCMPLWTLLGEKTDLKAVKSLDNIEKFLKTCNKKARKEFLGKEEACCRCEAILDGPPVSLPCQHILCDACLHYMQDAGAITCPTCKAKVKQDWVPQKQIENEQANEKLRDYQKRCNSFFMDVVSQLCFADNNSPSDAVIDKLLKYVLVSRDNTDTGQPWVATKKEMGLFETGIDPNPVFRSFLLQLMMQTSRETATRYLARYLQLITGRDVEQKESHLFSLSQLIIQCFEDLLLKESTSRPEGEVRVGTGYLRDAVHVIDTDQLTVDKLQGLAEARVGLAITAKYVDDVVRRDDGRVEHEVRRLIEAANTLCTELRTKMPRAYLVKYLCRRFGMDTYQGICSSQQHFLRWIALETETGNERVECSDRYVVCGDMYTQIREALTKVIIGEDAAHLEATLKNLPGDRGQIEVMSHLAIHREVTCSNLYPPARRKVTQHVTHTVEELVTKCEFITNKPLVLALVRNQLGNHKLRVQQGQTLRVQGIQCLAIHFMSALDTLAGDGTLIQPLICLMNTPQNAQGAYLPTMPQDDIEEVREALLANRGYENPVLYKCPNGHPYVIGDCGRPYFVDTCKTCGAEIGGKHHQALPGNVKHTGTDQTPTGHILGPAAARDKGPRPERQLTPLHCACVRLLTHLAMYAGTLANSQGVDALIKPNILPGSEPAEFLWQHIVADLGDVERGTGKSPDDVLLLMHAVVHNMMTTHRPGVVIKAEVCGLKSKEGRIDWEKQFSSAFLNPVFQDVNATLQQCNQQVLQDQRLGADLLQCLLYESETTQDPVHPGMLQETLSVWRYRTPISLDHLRQEFEAQSACNIKHPHKVLQHFLKENHHLQAIRFIPGILRLHRMLLTKFHRRLDKEEATTIRIGDLKRGNQETGPEIVGLIEDFAKVWELLREDIKVYVCPTELGGTVVPKEYCSRPITDDLPIAYLLPATRDMGLCSYVMLDFLMRKQNDFLTAHMKATGRSNTAPSTVSPRDITTAHLISYDPHRDILPLVLANCRYSFAMGSGTSIEYDFAGLERQLMDRFLFSKSRINIEETLKIDLMVYRAEVTNAIVFKKLTEKIPQDVLSGAVRSQISEEMRSLPELCTSLDNLDIAVSFLTSVGGDPRQNLYTFMRETLKMENSLTSQKARHECQFQHVQALWLHLSLLKSQQIAHHRQNRESMFDNIEDQFHACMPGELLSQFRDYMKRLSVDKLSQLVEGLHEYIVLEVSVRDNKGDDDYVDKATKRLFGWLYGYFDELERPNFDLGMLEGFPQEILIGHSSHAWAEAYRILQEKTAGHRH